MYKSRKKKRNKWLIFFLCIIVVVLIFISFMLSRQYTFIESGFKDIATTMEKIVMYPFTALNSNKDVDQSKSYVIQKNVNKSLEQEIEELEDQKKANDDLNNFVHKFCLENANLRVSDFDNLDVYNFLVLHLLFSSQTDHKLFYPGFLPVL